MTDVIDLEERRRQLEAAGLMPLRNVWVCDVSFEAETSVFLGWTHEAVVRQLAQWVRTMWSELRDDLDQMNAGDKLDQWPEDHVHLTDQKLVDLACDHERCWVSINMQPCYP
jgi:mannose/cellobiose epimerase-like protein (N-acyl-D-glucosamine 2-epimerase family)